MDREYIIAGFRIRLEQVDRLFVRPGSHMARAFEPFAAEADPAASLTMRLIPDCTINKELTGGEPNRELDVFPFDDAEADCHFERTPRGYTCSAWFPATGIVRRYSSKRSIRRMYRATCSLTDANPINP